MFVASVLAAFLTTACFDCGDERPPPLIFGKHVDYIDWYRNYVSKGMKGEKGGEK